VQFHRLALDGDGFYFSPAVSIEFKIEVPIDVVTMNAQIQAERAALLSG
jgi:hypothetical protein